MNVGAISGFTERERDFSFQTSTGDEININLYKSKSSEITANSQEGMLSGSFSFTQMEKFSFNIEGNGLTPEDKKEIAAAMKEIKPLIEEFFNQELEIPYSEAVDKVANTIASVEESLQEYAKSSLVTLFDNQVEKKQQEMQSDNKQIDQNSQMSEFQRFLEDILYKTENKDRFIYA